jgi:hypothetical protein
MDFNLMLVNEFVVFCIQLFLWYLVISIAVSVLRRYNDSTEQEVDQLKAKLTKMIHFVKEEQHGDMHYWFDEATDEFLAQGLDGDEIALQLKARFPTHVFILNQYKHAICGPDWKLVPVEQLKELNS